MNLDSVEGLIDLSFFPKTIKNLKRIQQTFKRKWAISFLLTLLISSVVLLDANNIIQLLGVAMIILKDQMTNQFGVEVIHFHSTFVVD